MTKTKAKKKSTIRLLFVCAIRTTGEGEVWRKALRGGLYLAYVGGEREAVLSVSRLAPAQPGKTELDIIRRDFNDAAADCGREIYE
ncbi:MAG: hypothetical protein M9941_15735, partial [Anaerolineae bacterium]|nr:hypothetical protein [Anaerolineae bacterium]